ncbi:MAG: pantoate--beta-alanine ligase, partial [Lentisphaeraceae bacterium]|nr:pantoate--beta-alanine ligase [Lentisphaeraceae bacterium]
CEDEGVTAIFFPPADEMYPSDSSTWVVEEKVSQGFCAAARPTHFRGVTSVVTKLFNATLPHCAIFGKKDYQQLQVLRRMARDLNMPIEIIGAPIHREDSGLAMSSRNRYLSDDEKKRATAIYRSMSAVTDKLNNAQMTLEQARQYIANEIKNAGGELDYIETVNAENLEIVDQCQGIVRCLVAAKFGPARLIDNMEIYRGK